MAKNNNMNFKINVEFAAKANKDLETYVKSLRETKAELGNRLGSTFLDDVISKAKIVQKEFGSMDKIVNNSKLTKKEKVSSLSGIITDAQKLIPILKNLNKTWLNDALKNNDEVLAQLDDIYEKQKKLSALKGKKTKATNAQTAASDELDTLGVSDKTKKNATALQREIKLKQTEIKKNQENGITNNKNLQDEVALLEKKVKLINEYLDASKKITNVNKELAELSAIDGKAGLTDVDKISTRFEKKENSLLSISESEEGIQKVTQAITELDGVLVPLEKSVDNLPAGLEKSIDLGEQGAEVASTLKDVLSEFGMVGITAVQVARWFRELVSAALEFYTSLDDALNQIYVVSNLSSDAVNSLKTDFINMAKETGMAIDDVTEAAVLFFQQGLNTDEVLIMTEVTSQFAKVAGIDAADAADKLTAAVNGYCLSAEDAATVADKFNKVAADTAADINELSTAFSKAAAQANQAGVSMDNYLAYIATMEEATREAPENIGTSLKTIFSRMQQVKMGENTEDDVEVNDVETALKSVGIALRDTTGELRDLEEVFDELGPKWNTLDRNTQAYLGTIIAGTRQQSRFITLMQNWDRVMEVSEASANSAGMQAIMHAKAMDSITSKVEQFQVAWQEFVSNLTTSDFIKDIVSWATKLVKALNNGVKPVTLMAMAVGVLANKLQKLQEPLVTKGKDLINGAKALFGAATGNFYSDKKDENGNVISGQDQKNADLATALDAEIAAQEKVNKLKLEQDKINQKLLDYQTKNTENGKLSEADQNKMNNLKTRESEINEELKADEEDLKNKTKERVNLENKQVITKGQAIAQTAQAAGMALNTIGLAIGQTDDALGGLVSGMGTLVTSVGQLASGNYLGAIVTGVMAVIQLIDVFADREEKMAAKITDSVNNVQNAIEEVTNYNTGIKSTEDLLDKYDELDKKLYKTETEQEELNSVIQELGDTYGIETVTDAYGNLSISIKEVNEALEEQRELRAEAAAKLNEEEVNGALDATSGFLNDNTLEDYYAKLFTTTRSSYKALMSGINDELTNETRNISSSLASELSNNLESAIMDSVEKNKFSYIGDGIAESLVGIEKGLNDAISSNDWNELYNEINFLQQGIDEMSYDEVQASLENFYANWSAANNLTQEQWNLLVDSINNTVFENSSLLEFYAKVNDMGSKMSGEYYNNQIKTIEAQKKLLEEETSIWEEKQGLSATAGGAVGAGAGAAAGAGIGAGIGALGGPIGAGAGAAIGAVIGAIGGAIGAYKASNTEEAKKLKEMEKAMEELEAQKQEYMQELVDSHTFLFNEEDAEKWYNAQVSVMETMQNLNSTTQNYLGTIDSLYNMDNMTAEGAEEYANSLKTALTDLEGLDSDAQRYNYLAQYYKEHSKEMSDEIKEQWEQILGEAFDNLSVTSTKTLSQIGTELQSISTDLQNMNSIVDEFNTNGSISLETFESLADIIDGLGSGLDDLGSLDPSAVNAYIDAIDNLNLAYDANTGQIVMNGDAVNTLRQIQEVQTKSKIAGMIADLKASKATTETEIAYIDAQIAATDAAIAAVAADSEAKLTSSEIKATADEAYTTNFNSAIEGIISGYENDVTNNGEWATTILSNIGKVSDAWNKYYTGIRNNSEISLDEIKSDAANILSGSDVKWEGGSSYSGIDWDAYDNGKLSQESLIADLKTYREELEHTKQSYQATLTVTNKEISLLEDLYNSDLSLLGTDGSATEEVEEYIGQLEEIYNILRKVEGIQSRLDNLNDYADIAHGQDYANYLKERIGLTQELTKSNEDLLKAQKYIEAKERSEIKGSSVGDVFSFDDYGNIIIDYQKYVNLQAEEMELADELYDEYQELREETQDYYDQLIEGINQSIEAQQELVDTYVDLETKLANAVKDIYQDMLDNKLDAIDTEINALDELKEAYDDANKAADDSKKVSEIQTSLKRSMMDTSGASNSKVLDYRDQLSSQLNQMGEDAYEKKMDDIKQALEDEKQALQDNFDEFFEDFDKLYELIDKEILTSEKAVLDVMMTTDEYKQASEAERAQLIDEWKTNYATAMTALEDGGSIMDVVHSIDGLRDNITNIDTYLKDNSFAEEIGTGVSRVLAEWLNGSGDSSTSDTGGGYTSSGGGGGGGITVSEDKTTGTTTFHAKTEDTSKIAEAAETAGSWWENFKSGMVNFFTQTIPNLWNNYIKPWFTLEKWDSLMQVIIQAIHDVITGIPGAMAELGEKMISGLGTAWNGVVSFFTGLWDKLWGLLPASVQEKIAALWDSFYTTIEPLVQSIKDLFSSLWDAIKLVWDTVSPYFQGIWEGIKSVFAVAGDFISGTFGVVWEKIKMGLSVLFDYIKLIFNNIKTVIQSALSIVGSAFSNLFNIVKAVWNNIVDAITVAIRLITAVIDTVVGVFTGDWDKIGNAWKNVWESAKDFFVGIFDTIKTTLGSFIDFFKDVGIAIWNAITGVFKNIGKFFKNVWEDIKAGFSAIGTKVADTFTSAIKAGLNGLMSTFEGIVNTFINLINGAINVINAIPGVDIKKLEKVSFKRFAKGGMADYTGPAWVDGTKSAPEAVLNASQTKAFMKLADNLDKIDTTGNGLGYSTIQIDSIKFEVESMSSPEDGEKAFDAFVNKFKEIGSQSGLSFTNAKI